MEFSNFELSVLGEIGNKSIGGAARTLSQSLKRFVTISVPKISFLTVEDIKKEFNDELIYIKIHFYEGLTGYNLLLMEKKEALKIANILKEKEIGMNSDEWDEIAQSAIKEMFNIMVGNIVSFWSYDFDQPIKIKVPILYEKNLYEIEDFQQEGDFVFVSFDVKLEDKKNEENEAISIKLIEVMEPKQAKKIIKLLESKWEGE